MKDQIFVGKRKPSRKLIEGIDLVESGIINKPRGGIWTSTYTPDEEAISHWIDWCNSNNFYDVDSNKYYKLSVLPDAKVFTINNTNAYSKLLSDYGFVDKLLGHDCIDFVKLSKDYDALNVTRRGIYDNSFTAKGLGLYAWDCESTIWFRWKFEKIEKINSFST